MAPALEPGGYELLRRIATAPDFHTYEACHPRRSGRVLVDVFMGAHVRPEAWRALAHVVSTLSSLRHPNLLQTLELASLSDGPPIVVSELPEGRSLRCWLDAGHAASARATAEMIVALADALALAHARGVHHGAIRAENVFLTVTAPATAAGAETSLGTAKLRGFGLDSLRDREDGGAPSATREIIGAVRPVRVCPGSVAPFATRVADDIAALAALAEEMLTWWQPPQSEVERRFFLGDAVIEVLACAAGTPPDAPFESAVEFAEALATATLWAEAPFDDLDPAIGGGVAVAPWAPGRAGVADGAPSAELASRRWLAFRPGAGWANVRGV